MDLKSLCAGIKWNCNRLAAGYKFFFMILFTRAYIFVFQFCLKLNLSFRSIPFSLLQTASEYICWSNRQGWFPDVEKIRLGQCPACQVKVSGTWWVLIANETVTSSENMIDAWVFYIDLDYYIQSIFIKNHLKDGTLKDCPFLPSTKLKIIKKMFFYMR